MRRLLLVLLVVASAGPLIADDTRLKDSEPYSAPLAMTDGTYYLRIQETGPIAKTPATDGVYTVDSDPIVIRDYTPPSQPDGLSGVALDSHTVRLDYLSSKDNIKVIGYQVYRYRNGNLESSVFSPTDSFTDTGLTPVTIYQYNVRAVDKSRNLSPLSNTVTVATLDATTQNSAPRFTINPFVSYLSSTMAVIGFTTDKATTATVDYGTTTSYGSSVSQPDYSTDHIISLTGLSPTTRYHFKVTVNDFGSHGPVSSRDDSFYTTFGSDTTAPQIIHGPIVAYLTNTIAVITFATDEDAKGSVFYGVSSVSEAQEDEADFQSHHAVTLSNLLPGTTYSYKVSERDPSGNGPVTSSAKTFKTKSYSDNHAPVILKKPDIEYVSDHLAIISWETDELSDSTVQFGTSRGTYNRMTADPTLGTQHTVVLTALTPDSQYFFVAWSTDPSGNASEKSREKVFTTNRSPDKNPPSIHEVEIDASSNSADISWKTEEPSDGKVLFGTASGTYKSQVYDGELTEDHALTLNGLQAGTTYYVQIIGRDPSGNIGQSRQYVFRTDAAGHGGGDGHGGGNGGSSDHGDGSDHGGGGNDHDGGNNQGGGSDHDNGNNGNHGY